MCLCYSYINSHLFNATIHRIRINTEEKAKVVTDVWGKECIHFLAVLSALHWDNIKNSMNCTRMI